MLALMPRTSVVKIGSADGPGADVVKGQLSGRCVPVRQGKPLDQACVIHGLPRLAQRVDHFAQDGDVLVE